MELARAFASNPKRPRRSLLFVVFAAEERGLLGSYYYVQHPLRPLETTRAVINFDMIGRDEAPSQQTDGFIQIAPDTSNEVNLIGTNYTHDYRRAVEKENEFVGAASELQVGPGIGAQHLFSQRPVPVCAARNPRHLVVHGLPSGLSPAQRHSR